MIDITILHWRISPYFICFLLSFVLAYLYVTWYLKKAGVRGSHIFYSELLNTVLALYFGAFYTFIVQLAEQGKVETFGFSSLGGMAGILLGVWIFTKISKEHKIELWTAYVLALGLRTLTLQTGDSYRKDIGLSNDELAVLIGSKAVQELHHKQQNATEQVTENYDEIGSESLEQLLNNELDYGDMPQVDFMNVLFPANQAERNKAF